MHATQISVHVKSKLKPLLTATIAWFCCSILHELQTVFLRLNSSGSTAIFVAEFMEDICRNEGYLTDIQRVDVGVAWWG